MSTIAFYFDESVNHRIPKALKKLGIDVLTAKFVGMRSKKDWEHLAYATQFGRVTVASDEDFCELAARTPGHLGIVYGWRVLYPPDRFIFELEWIHANMTSEQMLGTLIEMRDYPPAHRA